MGHGEHSILTLLEDTRNQKGKHKNIAAYCKQNGIEIIRTKLLVGDYMLAGSEGGGISVDTKTLGIPEMASNIFQEHERFRNECEIAQRCGIKLYILVEEMPPEGDLAKWVPPLDRYGRPKYRFSAETLKKAANTMTERYGVEFVYCDGRSTGKVLLELLKGVYRSGKDK